MVRGKRSSARVTYSVPGSLKLPFYMDLQKTLQKRKCTGTLRFSSLRS
jgi:hypothetical protein